MKVNCTDYTKQNTTFGYFLPEYCDAKKTVRTSDFISNVCQIKRAEGKEAYDEYMTALDNFRRRRFDATELHSEYKPKMAEYGKRAEKDYNRFIDDLEPPVYEGMKLVTQTREVEIKEKPLKRFLNFIKGKKPQTETITERVEKPVQYYDLSRINAKVSGIEFARYGSFFTGDNPPRDYYELNFKVGNSFPITLERHSADYNNSSRADKSFQKMLSSAEGLNELGNKIDENLKDSFKSHCEFIIDMEKSVQRYEQRCNKY